MAATPVVGHPVLLTATEVADMLKISRRTVRRLSDAGDLTYVQVNDSIRRFRPEDIEQFLAARLSGASS